MIWMYFFCSCFLHYHRWYEQDVVDCCCFQWQCYCSSRSRGLQFIMVDYVNDACLYTWLHDFQFSWLLWIVQSCNISQVCLSLGIHTYSCLHHNLMAMDQSNTHPNNLSCITSYNFSRIFIWWSCHWYLIPYYSMMYIVYWWVPSILPKIPPLKIVYQQLQD